jgi:outer membrane protein OmpA-like peptidoglycan-associated protein
MCGTLVSIRSHPGHVTITPIVLASIVVCVSSAIRASAQQVSNWPTPLTTYVAGIAGRVTGSIVDRRGSELLVRDETTHGLNVVSLAPSTAITQIGGFLNLDKKARDPVNLIPGLVIAVEGAGGDHGNLVAHEVTFHKSSLRAAEQTSAGDVDLRMAQRHMAAVAAVRRDSLAAARRADSLAALNRWVSNLNAYATRVMTTVTFAVGSAALTERARRMLDDAMAKGQGLDGYIIQVEGFADASGAADANQRLSAARADAVVAYLTHVHGIPPARIANPKGMGASRPAASNATPDGRAQNRRVEVRVMVNSGGRPAAR